MNESPQIRIDFVNDRPLEGEPLARRLASGPLPVGDALQYAIEIGLVLKDAHAAGRAYGMLSPEAVLLGEGGARLVTPSAVSAAGAAPYRSPEQVRGASADWRSDIFSFGALLYEMASGRRAFEGEGEDLDQAILKKSPPSMLSMSPLHAAMEGVIADCLAKNPARRRQSIQNAVTELKLAGRSLVRLAEARNRARARASRASTAVPPIPGSAPSRRKRSRMSIAVTGLALAAVVATVAAAVLYFHRQPSQVLRYSIAPPENSAYQSAPAISPDGASITFSAVAPDGRRVLWLQPLDEMHASVIPGTEDAAAPFWSPESDAIAFFAGGALKKVPVKGGPVETICPADASAGGGTWNRDGVILFAPGLSGGLSRVAATGGIPQPVLTPDAARAEVAALWPELLPGGRRFLFFLLTGKTDTTGVYVGSLNGGGKSTLLFASETNAVYSAGAGGKGYLLYIQNRNLTARSFDPSSLALEGDPATLVEDVGAAASLSLAPVSVSSNGTLVYQPVGRPTRQVVWLDRAGKPAGLAGQPGDWGPPRISPDGKRAVAARMGPDGQKAALWILEAGGGATPLGDAPAHQGSPVWSPDGTRIAFFDNRAGSYDLYVRPANSSGHAELLFKSGSPKYPTDWSRDGRYILFGVLSESTRSDIWALSVADRRAFAIAQTIYSEGYPALSPDGKWLAYQSDQSGRNEVYVERFEPGVEGTHKRWRISDGGGLPRWRADGAELFYMTGSGRVMAAAAHGGESEFASDPPHPLFQTRFIPQTWNLYDAAPDGQHFLVNVPLEWSNPARIDVLTHWTGKLKP